MLSSDASFNHLLMFHWDAFAQKLQSGSTPVLINGHRLDLASVVSVARFRGHVDLDDRVAQAIIKGAEAVPGSLSKGDIIYGVNTGYGGSADVRTQAIEEFQRGLIRGLHYGVLADSTPTRQSLSETSVSKGLSSLLDETALPLDDPVATTSMPETWIRASMLIRLNTLSSGASGVRLSLIDTLIQLLNLDIIPRVPLRGSISASGDLSPLSYVGGLMQGKPTLKAYVGNRLTEPRHLERADVALKEAGITPIEVRAKEGLAIVNGTATSAAVGALALHEALCQSMLSQVLTAMSVEALCGSPESFDPFFADVRPHVGQAEFAQNILAFLTQSKLVYRNDGLEDLSLRQDRYSIRTASQWIGPALEDLVLAHKQVAVELNSVTDNPIIGKGGNMLHGGNFQAKSITSAMEKTRRACQTIGQMLFTQCTELINPATNRGLSPNLVVDEPNESFMWKGTDILIAALQSELGFLSNSVECHVQPAEMGNQALNSLALISGRYTLSALEVLSQLSAAHLIALCQALDLRAMHVRFLNAFVSEFKLVARENIMPVLQENQDMDDLQAVLWTKFKDRLSRTSNMDSTARFTSAVESIQATVLRSLNASLEALQGLQTWSTACADAAIRCYRAIRTDYLSCPDATPVLGIASTRMYNYVRGELGVPFFGESFIRAAEWDVAGEESNGFSLNADGKREYHSIGGMITAVYQAMRSGALYVVVMECLRDSLDKEEEE